MKRWDPFRCRRWARQLGIAAGVTLSAGPAAAFEPADLYLLST